MSAIYFSIIILAIALSLDALGFGLVYGLRQIRIPLSSKIIICFCSILYSQIALILGNLLLTSANQTLAKIVGIGILAGMGLFIILQNTFKDTPPKKGLKDPNAAVKLPKGKETTLFQIALKSLGITIQIIRNPAEFDRDRSGRIDAKESLLLGLALSLDAIGTGVGSALTGLFTPLIPLTIGFFQMLFLSVGTYLGFRFCQLKNFNEKIFGIISGILLLCLALIRWLWQ